MVFWQLLANGIATAGIYVLLGLSFGIIYRVAGFFHFAHGAVIAAGGYSAYAALIYMEMPLALAVLFGIVVAVALGALLDVAIYRPMRRRGASTLMLLLGSLGLYIVLQNLISLGFGDATRVMRPGIAVSSVSIAGARMTIVQLAALGTAVPCVAAVAVLLHRTRLGTAIRAVASDEGLAQVYGVHNNRVILCSFAIGSAIAGISGILIALDTDLTPTMGMNALLMGVVAAIAGGVGSLRGVVVGAILLALAQQLGVWKLGSEWQQAIAFALLATFLLIRPRGICGSGPNASAT